MNSNEAIRDTVRQAYTRAVTSPPTGCCGAAEACDPKGVAAQSAGYDPTDLASLPGDAVVSSFGCGNPLSVQGVEPGQTVLDLGAGAGIDLLLAARRVGPTGRVIGVDMTDAMLERARANIAAAGLDATVEVRQGLIEELPVDDGTVDWVISNCVINLSPQKERVFAEIARVLRPGGRLSISDIVVEELPDEARNHPALHCACIGGAISEAAYIDGLAAAGLTDIEVAERHHYSGEQLIALVQSELSPDQTDDDLLDLARRLAPAYADKVWSARFLARKAA